MSGLLATRALLAQHGESESARVLAEGLRALCKDEAQRRALCDAGGHHALIGLLHAGAESKATVHAVAALVHLTSGHDGDLDSRIVGAGAIPPVVALLEQPSAHNVVVANATSLLRNLAMGSASHDEIRKAGAFPLLTSLLAHRGQGGAVVVDKAAGALRNLTCDNPVNVSAVVAAGAVPLLVATLRAESAEQAAGALQNVAQEKDGAAAIQAAGGVLPLVSALHEEAAAEAAAGALNNLVLRGSASAPHIILAALRPRPPPARHSGPKLENLLARLQPLAATQLQTAEAADDLEALLRAVEQAAAVRTADGALRRARARLAEAREARAAARRARHAALGLDELKTPAEFVCPITHEVMTDPAVASDGHTYERSAIAEVLAWPEERRLSPLTRAPLQPSTFPNIALRQRIASYEAEVEAAVEAAVRRALRQVDEPERSAPGSTSPPAASRAAKRPSSGGMPAPGIECHRLKRCATA